MMKELNELAYRAKGYLRTKAESQPEQINASCEDILAIFEAFRVLEQRAEAEERCMSNEMDMFANQVREIVKDVPGATVEVINAPGEWNGEGLPPVGVRFQVSHNANGYISWHTKTCTAVGRGGVLCVDEHGTELYFNNRSNKFRPFRSEEEIKRDDVIDALHAKLPDITYTDCVDIYNLIVADGIPHITLK